MNRSWLTLGAALLAMAVVLLLLQTPPVVEPFPRELVMLQASPRNPVFTAESAGHWDAKIRERGWIIREGDAWHLWYTGYDGTKTGIRLLGYATSPDGWQWTRWPENPLIKDHWVEDMCVIPHQGTYYMFAEGTGDQAQLLTSTDRVHWTLQGTLDVRYTNGEKLSAGPFGTPTVWLEDGTWYLFYERRDAGVWLATSRDLKVWTNVQDPPVLEPGPAEYDRHMIAMDQIIKQGNQYFAIYHGTAGPSRATAAGWVWNSDIARSSDLIHWHKYEGNPIVPDKSSGQVIFTSDGPRLYTMHNEVDVFVPKVEAAGQSVP